ncbi:MAG TPA: hypothetical protein VEA78_09205 [Acidimicrobiales bacterium]|nr:hypothetical protein [Acidimicrobiales bacterium]
MTTERTASRRELLKKLGAGTAALVWATPVVQTISTGTAWAADAKTSSGCSAISHLDLVIKKGSSSTKYGIQWDPGEGWSKHPTSSKHCLANDSWVQPTSSSFFSGFPTPKKVGDNYEVTFPSSLGVTVVNAYSKAGSGCSTAQSMGGNKWKFTPYCPGGTTTTAAPTTTTAAPTTTTTAGPSSSVPNKLSAAGSCRQQWWDASSKRGAWVGVATYTWTHNRHAYIDIEVKRTFHNNTTSTTTQTGFYVPSNGSAAFEVYDLPYGTSMQNSDVKSIQFKVVKIKTYNDSWQEQSYTVSGPTTTAACTPSGGTTTTTAAPTTTSTTGAPTTTSSVAGCVDIEQIELIGCAGSGCTDRWAVRWKPGSGWAKVTQNKTGSSSAYSYCLDGQTWTTPPSYLDLSDLPSPVQTGTSYRLTLPTSDIKVWFAVSKAGSYCVPGTYLGNGVWQFDRYCPPTTTTTSTTSTTMPTTTTTAPPNCDTKTWGHGTGSGSESGTGCEGSPEPGKDISHMDFILCRYFDSKTYCSEKYGVQYDFGDGWGPHPTGGSNEHCLQGLSKTVPPQSFSYDGFGSAISLGGGAYKIGLPWDVTVWSAFSKCGQVCRPATYLGYAAGKKWYRFDPC